MSEHKFTPGPWGYEVCPFGSAIHKDGKTIATAHESAAITKEELPHADNARLIAAAPEMLEALRMVSGMDIHHEALRTVDAAILKATGGSHEE